MTRDIERFLVAGGMEAKLAYRFNLYVQSELKRICRIILGRDRFEEVMKESNFSFIKTPEAPPDIKLFQRDIDMLKKETERPEFEMIQIAADGSLKKILLDAGINERIAGDICRASCREGKRLIGQRRSRHDIDPVKEELSRQVFNRDR